MKALAAIGLALLLTGCVTPQGIDLRERLLDRLEAADAQGLVIAERWLCVKGDVGTIVSEYGDTPERWSAWRTICGYVRVDELTAPEAGPLKEQPE